MRTWGIDWGTEKNKRAAVALDWSGGWCEVAEVYAHPQRPLTWDATFVVATSGKVVAVDVPFGWPEEFRRFLRAHEAGPDCALPSSDDEARAWRKEPVTRRRTEIVLMRDIPGLQPRSVAFDLLGATAASWAVIEVELCRRGLQVDRSGATGTIIETYPTAIRRRLGLPPHGVDVIELPGLDLGEFAATFDRDEHACDALVAAVAARARVLNLTDAPSAGDEEIAHVEGWIHVTRAEVGWQDVLAGR